MADNEKVVYTVEIGGYERAITSFKELKKAKKDAQDAFIAGDEKAAKAVAELTDKMEDLNDAAKSVKGSGIERTSASFSLLGDGLKTLDLDKVSTGFKGLGGAMKAIPLLLIVEGITYLVRNFDELSEGSGILAKILQGVGAIFQWLKDLINDFTDSIGLTNTALDEQGEAIKENADKSKEALESVTAAYDRQIKVAKATGKSTVELEKQKQQAIIDTNLQVAKQIEAFVRAGGVLDEEKSKLLTASLETIKNARVTQFVDEQAANKQSNEAYKKYLAERRKIAEEEAAYNKKRKSDELIAEALQEEQARRMSAANLELTDAEIKAAQDARKLAESAKAEEDRIANEKAANEKRKALNEQYYNEALAGTTAFTAASQNLSNALFAGQLANVEKGSAEELKIKKKQFEVNKALAITQAIIDGVKGVQSQLQAGPIIGPILAGVVGVTAAINVNNIRKQQFSGAGGGGIATSLGGGSATPSATPPQIIAPPSTQGTLLDQNGNQITDKPTKQIIEVQNVVNKTTEKQKEIATVENRALI